MSTGKIELSVGAVKYVDPNEIITEEEFDYIQNKVPELDERVGIIEDEIEEINSSLDNKANKNEVFSMANMGQDIREAISGGSVAVVGKNAILNGNIVNGQVTPEKTNFFIENLFDALSVEDGCYYDNLNNRVNNGNYVESDYIPILQDQILLVTKNCVGINTQIIKFYDLNKSFLNGQNMIGDNQTPGQIDQSLHSDCAYVRISFSKASLNEYMVTTGPETPLTLVPFGVNFKTQNQLTKQVEKNRTEIEGIKQNQNKTIGKWNNKKWCVVGDSITETNNTATIKYHDIIKDRLGCTVYNHGKSGTGYAVSYAGGSAIVDRIEDIPNDSDLITVFAGTNDWGRNLTTLGSFADNTKTTFYGALKLSIEAIIDKFPTKRIGVITPIPRNNYRNANDNGEYLLEYRNAILEVCEYFSIPCLDLYKESNFYVENSTFNTTYLPDGLHPNNLGHEILADKICRWLETI